MVLRMETRGFNPVVIMKDISFILLPRVKILKYLKQHKFIYDKWPPHTPCAEVLATKAGESTLPQILTRHQQPKEPPDPLWLKGNWKSDKDGEETGTLPISLSVPLRGFHTCIIKTELKVEIDFLMDNYNTMVEGGMKVRQA